MSGQKPADENEYQHPTVLIGVPVYNRGHDISLTLDSIAGLDYPKNLLSIVLIDRSSRESSLETLKQWEKLDGGYRKIVVQYVGFEALPKARNRILSYLTDEDYVFFVDGDIVLNRNSLTRLLSMANRGQYIAHITQVPPPAWHEKIFETDSDAMACTLIDSKLFRRDGLRFNEVLALLPEDLDFCLRSKHKVLVDGNETVRHLHIFSFRGRWTRYMRRTDAWMLFTLLKRRKGFGIGWDNRWPLRWLRYAGLFILSILSLLYLPWSLILDLPVIGYLAYSIWRRGTRPGFLAFLNAYLFVPTTVFGCVELLLEFHSSWYRARRDIRLSRP